jgi:hypothetical protein
MPDMMPGMETAILSVLGVLGLAFAAFCVWLGVRIADRRERWAKRTAVALAFAVLVLYPLSMGPVAWVYSALDWPDWMWTGIRVTYQPIIRAEQRGPDWIGETMVSYRSWWIRAMPRP